MPELGLIVGSSVLDAELPRGEWVAINRHAGAGEAGGEAAGYVPPHEIDHVAHLRRLAREGCSRVLAIGSVGGLRPELGPGTYICPDDFIALDAPPRTALSGIASHTVPGFDRAWRERVVSAFGEAGFEVRDGGVYWQSNGPRLETPAEIRLIAEHADVIGMTIASECAIATELGLRYAALCVVDNLANGVGSEPLTMAELIAGRAANAARLERALAATLPALA